MIDHDLLVPLSSEYASVCEHEAAHAIVARALGIRVDRILVDAYADPLVTIGRTTLGEQRASWSDIAAVKAAGVVVNAWVDGTTPHALLAQAAADPDDCQSDLAYFFAGAVSEFDRACAGAERMLAENAAAWTALTAELRERRYELTGRQVARICARAERICVVPSAARPVSRPRERRQLIDGDFEN